MLRKSAYQWAEWPSNGAGVVKKTPSATSLFGSNRMKHTQCGGCRRGDQMKSSQPTRQFWSERTP